MNFQIPLTSHINTKDEYIIHQIDSQDKDALNKKNTLAFQSTLSPMYIKSEDKVYTTSGHKITVQNNKLTDDEGREFSIDNSFVVKNSYDLTGLWTGEIKGACIRNGSIVSLWKTDDTLYLVRSDTEGNVTSSNEVFSAHSDTLQFSGSLIGYKGDYYLFEVVQLTNGHTYVRGYKNNITTASIANEQVNYTLGVDLTSFVTDSFVAIGFDDKDVRKRATYIYGFDGTAERVRGFGCIGSNGLVTGEPLPMYVDSGNVEGTYYDHQYGDIVEKQFSSSTKPDTTLSNAIFLENGVGGLKAIDTTDTVQDWIDANASLKEESAYTAPYDDEWEWGKWGGVQHKREKTFSASDAFRYDYVCGFDLNRYDTSVKKFFYLIAFPYSGYDRGEIGTKVNIGDKSVTYAQVDFSEGLGNLEWKESTTATFENGCNPFPRMYYIFNKADARGKYWDYGPGWVKTYIRYYEIDRAYAGTKTANVYWHTITQRYPDSIISYGTSSASGALEYKVEALTPMTKDSQNHTYALEPTDEAPLSKADKWYEPRESDLYFRFHLFNPSIFTAGMTWIDMVGADNMPNHSVLLKIPFNVEIDPVLNIKDQYFQGNYMSTSMQGTLLTSASVNKNTPSIVMKVDNTNAREIFSNGLLIEVVPNGDIRLEKVSDYLYKTNNLTGNNFFVDSETGLDAMRGFIPYNGEEDITVKELEGFSNPSDNENPDGNDTYYSASGYNVQMNDMTERNVSYLLPAFQLPLVVKSEEVENFSFQLLENKRELTKPFLLNQFTYKDDVVDHYYTHSLSSTSVTYQTGKKMESRPTNIEEKLYGVKTYDIDKEAFVWWITSSIQIFPVGIASKIIGINYLSSSVDMTDDYTVRLYRTQNVTFPVFNPNTEVYRGSTIFTIYGYNYSFDGQSIYYLGSGDDTSQSNFACYALGMKFLANSGTEAYFYSTFEKRIYLFTGSVTLQMADSLAREGTIVDSVYSSHEQVLYLLTDEGRIIARTQEDMCVIDEVDPSEYHFESTNTGMILVGKNSYKKYRLWKTDEEEWLPIEYETEYLGKNDSLYKVATIEITFFKGDGSTIKGNINYECMNDKLVSNETLPFQINKVDWKDSALTKVILAPKNNICKAFKFGVTSDDYIHIANVCVNIEEVSTTTNSNKRI